MKTHSWFTTENVGHHVQKRDDTDKELLPLIEDECPKCGSYSKFGAICDDCRGSTAQAITGIHTIIF